MHKGRFKQVRPEVRKMWAKPEIKESVPTRQRKRYVARRLNKMQASRLNKMQARRNRNV